MDGCQRRESLRCGKMSEKRFKLHIEWSNIDKTDGIAELSDNGQPLLETECIEDARLLQTILNELNEENEVLKQQLKTRYVVNKQYEELQRLREENKELKLQLEAFKDKLCELGVSDVKLYEKRYYTGLEEWLNE